MDNIPTADKVWDNARTKTPAAKPELPTNQARAADAWRQVLRRRVEHLAGRWSMPIAWVMSVLGRGVAKWVARACAAAEDAWREVQASRRGSEAVREPGDGTRSSGSDGPAAQATNGPLEPERTIGASGPPGAATGGTQEAARQAPEPRAGAGYDTVRMLEALSAQPLRDLLPHLLPALEYQEVVQPVLAEIHRVYTRFIFRPPSADEIARHVHAFYERFPTLADRCQAIREGDVRPHLGIRPLTLETDVTSQCNLRCVMCHFSDPAYSSRKREDMSVENFTRIAQQAFPLCRTVHLTSICESLLHPRFGDLLAITKSYGVPDVCLTTNGLLLNDEKIEQLVVWGLDRISISIDAATEPTYERIRRKGKFDRLIANIGTLNRAKQRHNSPTPYIVLNFVMMRSNIEELPAFVRLAHELGAAAVLGNHLLPYETLHLEGETLDHDPELCNRMMDEARELAREYQIEIRLPVNFDTGTAPEPLLQIGLSALAGRSLPAEWDWDRFQSFGILPWGDESHDHCLFPWHAVIISHDGWVSPCVGYQDGPPMGNIFEEPFEDLWNNHRYRALRSDHMKGTLKDCWTCPAAGMGNVNDKTSFVTRKLV